MTHIQSAPSQILTNFWKQYRRSCLRYWKDKSELFFRHFPSHWPASRAISLPYRLECCFWALLWSLAYWHKFYSSKISIKRKSQIRGSWWIVNIPGRVVLKKAILTGHQDFRIWFHRNSFFRDFWRVNFMTTSQIPYKSSKTTFGPKW